MKRMYLSLIACACIAGISCTSKPADKSGSTTEAQPAATETVDMHTAENSLDYPGVYEGTIPAASGPGIKMTLTLNKDKTFKLRSEYIDEKDGIFNEQGKYVITGNIVTLELPQNEKKYFKVEEGRVRMLDQDQKVIEGALAEHYILKQTTVF